MRFVRWLTAGVLTLATAAGAQDAASCLVTSGRADTHCLTAYAAAIERCRRAADAECESALRAEGGRLTQMLAAPEEPIRLACDDPASERLGYTSTNDAVTRAREWCADFGEDLLSLGFADDLTALDGPALACQRALASQLRWLRRAAGRLYGPRCALREGQGRVCARARRDGTIARLLAATRARIEGVCGSTYDTLALGPLDALLDAVVLRARHFAVRAYPPNLILPHRSWLDTAAGVVRGHGRSS